MKRFKTIFTTLALCLGLVAGMASCSDNDDEPENEQEVPTVQAANSVAGTYNGNMTCSVMGSESVFEDMTFTVTSTDDATVNVKISPFGNPPMKVPEISVTGVKVSGKDGKYSLAATEFQGTTDGKTYSGTMQGSFEGNTLTIKFNLQYGAMPMPMICTFTAPKK